MYFLGIQMYLTCILMYILISIFAVLKKGIGDPSLRVVHLSCRNFATGSFNRRQQMECSQLLQ